MRMKIDPRRARDARRAAADVWRQQGQSAVGKIESAHRGQRVGSVAAVAVQLPQVLVLVLVLVVLLLVLVVLLVLVPVLVLAPLCRQVRPTAVVTAAA
jgi:hypothetical protein